ncbi:unnamed protein product [Paramecium octaurelia]|uniref:Uncharacterized protein n=1 Tax=Paramecium octaurelia TaxID=43137 RepID=A0A8S1XR37_PAROT|nr:unnamed protein product [Paramecium octaurelia]
MSNLFTKSIKHSQQSQQSFQYPQERLMKLLIMTIQILQENCKQYSWVSQEIQEETSQDQELMTYLEGLNRHKLQIQQSTLFSYKRIVELETLVGIQERGEVFQERGRRRMQMRMRGKKMEWMIVKNNQDFGMSQYQD